MSITNAEWKIMNILWEESPKTITQLTEALKAETGWTKHTIITLLKRMTEKNTVKFIEGGKAKLFYPLISKEEAEAQETDNLLEKVFHGSSVSMISTMLKKSELKEDEIQEICKLLNIRKDNS